MRASVRPDDSNPTFHVHGDLLGIALLHTFVLFLRPDISLGVEGAMRILRSGDCVSNSIFDKNNLQMLSDLATMQIEMTIGRSRLERLQVGVNC